MRDVYIITFKTFVFDILMYIIDTLMKYILSMYELYATYQVAQM